MQDTTLWSPQSWIWNRSRSIKTYHSLWKIEESFRITKSYLDARPVYVHKKETIYGHFLICYLSLFLLRVLRDQSL